jgi:colanic acid/amylovoran biosynthesis protein
MERGYTVALFPNATRGDDMYQTHNNDLPLLAQILARVSLANSERLVAFDRSINAAQVHSIINTCNAVITSRFHAMVGALACGKPVMVLGWSHKYLEVMERFGQEDMVLDDVRANNDTLNSKVDDLISSLEKREQQIAESLPAVKDLASRQIEHVKALLVAAG